MRYLDKGSVSSFLGVALNLAWSLCFVAMGGILLAMPFVSAISSRLLTHGPRGTLTFDAQFLSFGFTRAEVRNPQAIVLGILGLTLVTLVVAQAIIHQLRRIFRALQVESAFTVETAKRIRAIGLIFIGGSLLQSLAAFLVGLMMMNNLVIQGVELNVKSNFHLSDIFIGLVILVLAEIFRHGAALQKEQDLTV